VRLRRGVAQFVLPSTERITDRNRWKSAGLPLLEPIHPCAIEPGDWATVNTGANKSYGDHWVIVEDVLPGAIATIEGNASGQLGNSKQGHGVIFRTRDLSSVRRVYRLEEEHFEQ
ncbi:MAG: hypothetical protein ACNA8W_22405, partial [Bradymonadaceae bacterium]